MMKSASVAVAAALAAVRRLGRVGREPHVEAVDRFRDGK